MFRAHLLSTRRTLAAIVILLTLLVPFIAAAASDGIPGRPADPRDSVYLATVSDDRLGNSPGGLAAQDKSSPSLYVWDQPSVTVQGVEDFDYAAWGGWWVRHGSTGVAFTFRGMDASKIVSDYLDVDFNLSITNRVNGEEGLDGLLDVVINPGVDDQVIRNVLFDNLDPTNRVQPMHSGGTFETRAHVTLHRGYIHDGTLVLKLERHVDSNAVNTPAPIGANAPIDLGTVQLPVPIIPLGVYQNDDPHTVHIGVATDPNGAVAAPGEVVVRLAWLAPPPPNHPPNAPSTPTGPTSGAVGTSYSYSTSATDPDGDQVYYTFDWGDGTAQTRAPASGCVNSGTAGIASHSWASPGTYLVKAKATDALGAASGWSGTLSVVISAGNRPPNTPSTPTGPTSGAVGTSYSYSTSATDPDGDQVFYWFDWADGPAQTRAPASGYVNSGVSVSASHAWAAAGTYQVKAMAIDSKGAASGWSSLLTVVVTAAPSGSTVDIPHYHSFIVEISRPVSQKAGWIFARENDNIIAGCTLTGQKLANIGDTTKDKLLEITGMGGVRDTGTAGARKLEIYSAGNVVEWSLWYGPNSYTSGEVLTTDPPDLIDIPHYHSFIVEISRPASQKAGWIFARENDNIIVGCTLTGQKLANIGDTTKDKLLEIAGMGGVRDTGTAGARKLEIYSTGNVVEWSLWYGPDGYFSGDVQP